MGSKKAIDLILDRFLEDVEEKGMPWQRPYERYNAFNYFSKRPYQGFNRLLLPFGEYVTGNQIYQYNEKTGNDFRYQKGIQWYYIPSFSSHTKQVDKDSILKMFPDADLSVEGLIGYDNYYNTYYIENDIPYKQWNVLVYHKVAEIQHFKNSKGETLPSRVENGEMVISQEEPERVIQDYLSREGIKVLKTLDCPCYSITTDTISLNPSTSQKFKYATIFHEIAHSTGAENRLNRKYFKNLKNEDYLAREECVAEITACLLCAECGVKDFQTSGTSIYENNLAYVRGWKKRVKDWGTSFISIVHEADKAFNYILNLQETEESIK